MPADEMVWSKFHWADFLNDLGLRSCSLASQGLWWRVLGRAFLSRRRGYLEDARGRAITPEILASLEGVPVEQVRAALEELEAEGVFSRDESGIIYSRRMVRDEDQRERGRTTGRRGGNPLLKRQDPHESRDTAPQLEGHPLAEAFNALRATGKLDSLTIEALAMASQSFPKANLTARFSELVTHVESLAGTVGDPFSWLRKRLSLMEREGLGGDKLNRASDEMNIGPPAGYM